LPFVPAINVADVQIVFELDGQICEVSQEVSATDLTIAGLTAIGATVIGAWTSAVMPLLSADLRLDSVVVTDVSTATGPIHSTLPATLTVGGLSGMSLPGNCAICVTKQTAARGRSAKGRFYVPGIPSNERVGVNRMEPTWMTDFIAGLDDFFAALVADSFEPVIVSRVTAGADRGTGLVQVMTQYRVFDSVIDSQRRRLPGRGF
jgi:hypothetical protein